jgi:hypothetical protein
LALRIGGLLVSGVPETAVGGVLRCACGGWSGVRAGRWLREAADVGSAGPAEPGNFVVLGGEAGQRGLFERGQFGDGGVPPGQAGGQGGELAGELGDLAVPRVGVLAGCLQCADAVFEVLP